MSDTTLHKIMSGVMILVLTVIMNTWLRFDAPRQPQQITQTKTVKETPKPQKEYKSVLTNNQLAAIFLAFPLGGMVWITIIALAKNRETITRVTREKLERESRVVF